MPVDYNILVDGGNFSPSTTLTPEVAKYKSFKTGVLINYEINLFNGHWAAQQDQNPPNPNIVNTLNVDVDAWLAECKARGIDYAAITVVNEYGFIMYPSEVAYNMPQITLSNNAVSPYFTTPYCVKAGFSDLQIIQKFITACLKYGIEPLFYIGLGGNSNLARASMWGSYVPTDRKELFIQYYCKLIQEMARKFPEVKYYWYDMADALPAGSPQRFYDAFKSINPKGVIIGNVIGEYNFERYPYDIQSTEEYAIYNGNTAYQSETRVHDGIAYHIPQEIVATIYGRNSQWYYYDSLCPVQPVVNPLNESLPYVKMQAQNPEEFQGIIDKAREAKIPIFWAILIDRYGNLVEETMDYAASRDFSYPHNILPNQQNLRIARTTKDFFQLGINESNMTRVTRIGNPNTSYDPKKAINRITGIERNSAYYFRAKKKVDLLTDTSPSIPL